MDLGKYHNIIVVTNFGGVIEVRDQDGALISPESVINFMYDVKKKQKRQASGK